VFSDNDVTHAHGAYLGNKATFSNHLVDTSFQTYSVPPWTRVTLAKNLALLSIPSSGRSVLLFFQSSNPAVLLTQDEILPGIYALPRWPEPHNWGKQARNRYPWCVLILALLLMGLMCHTNLTRGNRKFSKFDSRCPMFVDSLLRNWGAFLGASKGPGGFELTWPVL